MSANRKLLTEIQQVIKKYEEGVLLFDEIWEKVYAAEQQSLKEKYESDLKKEIKKLQRLRDQIKTWIGSNEIKDKSQLIEARKVIESKMEQFKICEKDTKTKAYSKEGLAREARQDPKEALKEEKRGWLNECLEKLGDLIDSVEADKEKLTNVRGKAKGNKEQLEKFDNRVQKHKWHVARLERIIKLIDNDDLEPSMLDSIKDSLEYYLESAVDDDGAVGIEDEFDIYEDLQLDSIVVSTQETAQRTELDPESAIDIESAVGSGGDATQSIVGSAGTGVAAVGADSVGEAAFATGLGGPTAASSISAKKTAGPGSGTKAVSTGASLSNATAVSAAVRGVSGQASAVGSAISIGAAPQTAKGGPSPTAGVVSSGISTQTQPAGAGVGTAIKQGGAVPLKSVLGMTTGTAVQVETTAGVRVASMPPPVTNKSKQQEPTTATGSSSATDLIAVHSEQMSSAVGSGTLLTNLAQAPPLSWAHAASSSASSQLSTAAVQKTPPSQPPVPSGALSTVSGSIASTGVVPAVGSLDVSRKITASNQTTASSATRSSMDGSTMGATLSSVAHPPQPPFASASTAASPPQTAQAQKPVASSVNPELIVIPFLIFIYVRHYFC
jgi:hypothetical protein